mgnify:CR=1 FL=1|jgi:hypothetical protein
MQEGQHPCHFTRPKQLTTTPPACPASYADGMAREATEIQNIQIADGSICHGWPIPIHMIFPRLFTCPTVLTRTFKVEFEVNLVILFHDGHLLTENFPLKLLRSVGT